MADDFVGNLGTTAVILDGSFVEGNIEVAGDQDYFKVTLIAGTTYRFDLEGVDTSRGTLANPWLDLYNTSGISLASDNDTGTGLNSQITYTAGAS